MRSKNIIKSSSPFLATIKGLERMLMKHIHIYISEQTNVELTKIKQKYKVSFSTIIDKAINSFELLNMLTTEQKDLTKNYIDENKKQDTTIILNKQNIEKLENSNQTKDYNSISKFLSNIAYLLTKNEIKNIYDEYKIKDKYMKANSKFYNELNNAKDKFWDYNNQYRMIYRANKQYEREQKNN